jgi:hypothetical protein
MFLRADELETRSWQGFQAMPAAKHREDSRKKKKNQKKIKARLKND